MAINKSMYVNLNNSLCRVNMQRIPIPIAMVEIENKIEDEGVSWIPPIILMVVFIRIIPVSMVVILLVFIFSTYIRWWIFACHFYKRRGVLLFLYPGFLTSIWYLKGRNQCPENDIPNWCFLILSNAGCYSIIIGNGFPAQWRS